MLVLMILPAAILASSWLLIRLFIVFLHVKYKLKISFDVDKFCQLKNIEICKLSVRDRPTDTDSTRHSTFQLKVDNVWLSSCFLNRNVDERLGICFNTISINYVSSQYLPDSIPSNSSSTSTMLFLLEKFQKSSFMNSLSTNSKRVIKLFLDYLGGVYVNRFTVTINHQLVHLSIDKFKGRKILIIISILIYLNSFSSRVDSIAHREDQMCLDEHARHAFELFESVRSIDQQVCLAE